jgi:hypothetical protein
VLRAKLVLLAAEGQSNADIGERLGMSTKAVGRWRRRFHERRLEGLADQARSGRPRRFPAQQIAEVKAVACEPPSEGCPLSRRSTADVHRLVLQRGICDASQSTIVRWLREDAIRPWRYRSWIFPTDPDFAEKAGRILDLYQGRWEGKLLEPGDLIISADEKPSIHWPSANQPNSRSPPHDADRTYDRQHLGVETCIPALRVRWARLRRRGQRRPLVDPS